MLKYGEINPLNVFGLRRLEFNPPHFSCVRIESLYVDPKTITDWIFENLTGRFCFIDEHDETPSGSQTSFKCACFENPGEASMFALMLDQINPRTFFNS
jgi:hypothetical protein